MFNISLKWRIFWFYVCFGIVPLAVVSWFGVHAYTRSIESLAEKHITELVNRIADQTDTFCNYIRKDLDRLAHLPYIQLSFHEFQSEQRMELIREKLERFRNNSTYFKRLLLYAGDGRQMVCTPLVPEGSENLLAVGEIASDAEDRVFHTEKAQTRSLDEIMIMRRVYGFRNGTHTVGYILAQVDPKVFTVFLERLDIGEEIEKAIVLPGGRELSIQKASGYDTNKAPAARHEYRAAVPSMDWEIVLRIPERVLFADVKRLIFREVSFILLVVAFAVGGSLAFSRRITRPLSKVIQGTREFAAGRLGYRIRLQSGYEGRKLAEAFNSMADQLRKRQDELIQYNKLAALGLMSAGIAHEVKNPLAGIKTSTQVVAELLADSAARSGESRAERGVNKGPVEVAPDDYEDIAIMLKDIASEVDRLNKIVSDLMEFGRPRSSNHIRCDLSDIVQRALHLLQKKLDQKGVKVVNKAANAFAHVDADQIMQVLVNLTLNAIEAVEPDLGVITISSEKCETGETRIRVADNGCGIPEAKISQMFDPFFTLSSNGTGLGLSVVYTLLKQNDASIDVESRIDEGTVFTLTFRNAEKQGEN